MSSGTDRSRERAVTVGAAAALTASAVLFTLMASGTGDYAPVSSHIASTTDDAAPAIAALLHGNIAGFAHDQPALGLTSILLRLPFAGLARLLGSGLVGEYRAGAFACLLACVVLGTVLARSLARRGVAPVAPPTSPGARAHYAVMPGGLHRRDAWLSILAAAVALRALGARRRLAPEDGLRLLAALVLVRALPVALALAGTRLPRATAPSMRAA